jgi:hypothetical protein
VLQFFSMLKRNSAKILSILMGLIGGLVVIFLIMGSFFPDLNFPTLSDLLNGEVAQEADLTEKESNDDASAAAQLIADQAQVITLSASEDNTSAWDLLIANHQIIFQEYDFGVFIEGIDGLKADQENFWAIYVNGEKSQTGISDIVLNANDVLEFKYEAIEESYN